MQHFAVPSSTVSVAAHQSVRRPATRDESTAPPRLLFVGSYLPSALGSRGVAEDLADRLIASGWQVALTSRHPSPSRRVAEMLATAWRARRRYDVALVDVYSGRAFRWAEAICRLLRWLGKPYVLTLHGGNLPTFARRAPRRVRRLLEGAAAVTAPSRYLADALADARADIRVLPNPIDPGAHHAPLRARPAPRLVWLRAFHAIYNPSLAPRVIARLVAEFPEIALEMIGPDKDGTLARVRDVAAALGVVDRVAFPGGIRKSEVPLRLAAADIFLNTTDIDNSPVSVLEAMASGLCIVSTNVGGIPFLLEHEREALLVPPGDEVAMAAAVRRVLTEPALAARLSAAARRRAEAFGWPSILPRWRELFAAVGATGAGRDA